MGLRWRTQAEVVSGKGQFRCGAKGCEERRGLSSFEVNLGYQEAGARKNALVKLRLCPAHGLQLNYKKNAEILKVRIVAPRATVGLRKPSMSCVILKLCIAETVQSLCECQPFGVSGLLQKALRHFLGQWGTCLIHMEMERRTLQESPGAEGRLEGRGHSADGCLDGA